MTLGIGRRSSPILDHFDVQIFRKYLIIVQLFSFPIPGWACPLRSLLTPVTAPANARHPHPHFPPLSFLCLPYFASYEF